VQDLIAKGGIASHEICITPVHDAVKSALAAKGVGFLELEARRSIRARLSQAFALGQCAESMA
jgi:hypothetical protein